IGGAIIPLAIDELPLLALLATQAEGTTTIRDAAELRVKESDRIASTATMLRAFGANIEEQPDGWIITGPTPLHGAEVDSAGDHRLAMLGVIAGLVASGETLVHSTGVIGDSFPTFVACLRTLGADLC
ncbi:MAG: 3-phosphoshikimate 1-carboxyvinyltransferase, partial [bacterium]